MYGPPLVGKLDRLRLEGLRQCIRPLGGAEAPGHDKYPHASVLLKLSASKSRFLNQAWDAADDRLAIRMIGSQTLGKTSFGWGDRAAVTPPAPPDALSQTAWCRAGRPKRSGSVCWPRQPPRHCRARGSTRRQPIDRGMLAWSPVSR